jgi:hypothetical protein
MLIFKIIYYCYFSMFDVVVVGQVNREFVVKLLTLAIMSLVSAFVLALFTHYAMGINFNSNITLAISLVFIFLFYFTLVHKYKHNELILRVKKLKTRWQTINYIIIYSFTFLIFFLYFNVNSM